MRLKVVLGIMLSLLSLLPGLIGRFAPQASLNSSIDLNELMLEKFIDWDATVTTKLDINGTILEPYDRALGVTPPYYQTVKLSSYGTYLPLVAFYEGTGDNYYLQQLKLLVDAVINNAWFRANATGVGEVIYLPQFWSDGAEGDSAPIWTMECAIASVKLYQWTGEARYKELADRIVSESLQLAVINNSTDLAWSYAYYKDRTEEGTKAGVNRQGSMAHFYGLYGSVFNSSYLDYVPRIVNWIWRAQVSDGGLAYSIGESSAHADYSAYALAKSLWGYNYASSLFSETLKTKMNDTLSYLQNGIYGTSYLYYNHEYISASAYVSAIKTNFLTSPTSSYLDRTKTILYTCLQMLNSRQLGLHTTLDEIPSGFRWSQYFVGRFFFVYPLPNNLATYTQAYFDTEVITAGRYKQIGAGIAFLVGRKIYVGDSYGLTGIAGNYADLYVSVKSGSYSRSITSTDGYYTTWSNTSNPSLKILQYVYNNGIVFGNVTGTSTIRLCVAFSGGKKQYLRVENGTIYELDTITNGTKNFGNKFMVVRNDTTPNQISYFVYCPSVTSWTVTRYGSSYAYIEAIDTPNYNVTMMYLPYWRSIKEKLIDNWTDACSFIYDIMKNLTLEHHSLSPIDYDTQISLYKAQLNTIYPFMTEFSTYRDAVSSEVKLIGHDNPLSTSIMSWKYANNKLGFTINSTSGTTSTTKIYCDDKGEPKAVYVTNGTLSWSYNASTKILTLNVLHNGPANMLVDWRILGDVNGDGKVDYSDLFDLSRNYGSHTSKPNWNPDCDFNRDSKIDASDLFDLGRNYGKTSY